MTGASEDPENGKKSLCPLSCMGRRQKGNDPGAEPSKKDEEIPAPIDEFEDMDMEEPGYAVIGSLNPTPRETQSVEANAAEAEEPEEAEEVDGDRSDSEDGEPIEEVVESQTFNQVEASVVYAQVNKPTAPAADVRPAAGGMYDVKKAEGIPTPRSAAAPPTASYRSAKRVNFDEQGPSVPPPAEDIGAFGDFMQSDHELQKSPAGDQKLLPGVSLSSYGAASLTAEQAPSHHESPRRFLDNESQDSGVETQNLKKTIRRLTAELSRELTSRARDEGSAEGTKLLPGKGPVPPWLCDSRVFAPLLAAYEQRLVDRVDGAERCETKLAAVELRIKDVVKENERLRLKLKETQVAGPAAQSELDAVTEQARLVLEENQLMIHQLGLQQDRARQAHRAHAAEVLHLKNRAEELEVENAEVREEFDRLRKKLQEVKAKYQDAVMEREDQDLLNVDRVKSLTRELQEARDQHKMATDELLRQLQVAERERNCLADALADASAEREKLNVEVKGLKELLQKKHRDNLLLQKFAKKHSSLQKYLDSVIHEATNLQDQRDSCKAALEAQEKEFQRLAQQLLGELRSQKSANGGGSEDEPLHEGHNGVARLERLIGRLVELLKDNEAKRDESEKQVKYLQSLLKEKSQQLQLADAEKRNVEDELEAAWRNAADAE